jgi:HK97 gp10 family phage protein
MFEFGIQIKEIEGLQKKLRNVPLYLNKEFHLSALRSAARPIYNELDHTTPYQFGHLVSDLTIRNSKFQKENEHTVIVGYKRGVGHYGYIGRFLEFGTQFISERRFMRRAEENNMASMKAIYVNKIQHKVNTFFE